MKRTFKYALATVLGIAMVAPAFAQDNFPDVPENHWAYEALARLRAAGILVGYPDGLFRGGRPASRYEMAIALHAAYQNLRGITDGLQTQIRGLEARIPQGGGTTTQPTGMARQADVDALRTQLQQLQTQVQNLQGLQNEIANLRRMTDTFQRELQALGVDVEAMRRDLGDLADRVRVLESRRPAVDVSGDANFWLGAGHSVDNRVGLNMDGRIVGTDGGGNAVGFPRDLTILHEVALVLAGTNETGPQWRGTIVTGNMLGQAGAGFGNQSQPQYGFGYREGNQDFYIQDFGVRFGSSVLGLGFNAEVGRVGYKVNPYMYQRMDNTTYFANERWDNGHYIMDGGILGFNFGAAKLDVFAGRTAAVSSVNGVNLNPLVTGPVGGQFGGVNATIGQTLNVDRVLGTNFHMPLTSAGNLNLAFLWLESDQSITAQNANRLGVWGGSADFAVGNVRVEGGYSQSDLTRNNSVVNNRNNRAFNLKLGWQAQNFGVWGEYREIDANYLAPGDWGRLGIMRNPTNIRGFRVGGDLHLGGGLTLRGLGEFYEGKNNAFAATTGFNRNTRIDKLAVDLGFKVGGSTDVMVGYEDTRFRNLNAIGGVGAPGQPHYRWFTVGAGYGLSDQARLSVAYQLSDVRNEFFLNPGQFRRFSGGFLTTQLSVKF
jgi:hypothetical protein